MGLFRNFHIFPGTGAGPPPFCGGRAICPCPAPLRKAPWQRTKRIHPPTADKPPASRPARQRLGLRQPSGAFPPPTHGSQTASRLHPCKASGVRSLQRRFGMCRPLV